MLKNVAQLFVEDPSFSTSVLGLHANKQTTRARSEVMVGLCDSCPIQPEQDGHLSICGSC